jgi:uncharacterized protein affecting Mg2+/Co2+ transport
MDVVAFGKLKMRDQLGVSYQLTDMVRNTREYRLNEGKDSVICRPVGDGMAVVFFSELPAPIRCAIEISANLKNQALIQLRMGIHSGPVYRTTDINRQADVQGEGIIKAQRVMDAGDANHILLSRAMAEILIELGEWNDYISEIGIVEDKHRKPILIYNFSSNEFGNPNPPKKVISAARTKPLVHPANSSAYKDQAAIKTETGGSLEEPTTRAKNSRRGRVLNCGNCGMLLPPDSMSCIHCRYRNA